MGYTLDPAAVRERRLCSICSSALLNVNARPVVTVVYGILRLASPSMVTCLAIQGFVAVCRKPFTCYGSLNSL